MQVDIDRLHRYHEDGKLRHSVDLSGRRHVWCYSPSTVFTRSWDDLTRLCRGLVTDDTGTVLSRPFPKFFNWGEPEAPPPEVTQRPFWAYDKEDGSLINVGLDSDGEPVVSTKGSFQTWHSAAAREMLGGWKPVEGSTAVFEFIHPENRIVLNYDGYAGLILLGAVANEDGCDHFSPEHYAQESGWPGDLAKPRMFNLQTMLRTVADPENGPNREGFVLLWPNPEGPSPRVKVKYVQYLLKHQTMTNTSSLTVWEALKSGTIDTLVEVLPDELYEWVNAKTVLYQEAFTKWRDTVIAEFDSIGSTDNRRDFAEIARRTSNPGAMFELYDGKNIDRRAWEAVRPNHERAWGKTCVPG